MGGYFFFFKLSEIFNRRVVEELLSETNPDQLLILQVNDISKVTRNGAHEIVYEGKRYDVKNEFSKDGITSFYCINDKTEEYLYNALHKLITKNANSQNQRQNPRTSVFLKYIFSNYFSDQDLCGWFVEEYGRFYLIVNQNFLSQNYFSIISPPPEADFI